MRTKLFLMRWLIPVSKWSWNNNDCYFHYFKNQLILFFHNLVQIHALKESIFSNPFEGSIDKFPLKFKVSIKLFTTASPTIINSSVPSLTLIFYILSQIKITPI